MIPRAPDRAAAMVRGLEAEGAIPQLVPLIDFEFPSDTSDLDQCLALLSEGRFAWLVITSTTTIRALKQRARSMGRQLALMIPAVTRVAAVGNTTRDALVAEGIAVHFVPAGEQSGRSLVKNWPLPEAVPAGSGISNRVLVPQADIASATVAAGITERGWQVLPVIAYRTVDYPAVDELKISEQLAETGGPGRSSSLPPALTVDAFRTALHAGNIDAVILTSPSVTRRVALIAGKLPERLLMIAIGEITAAEAALVGVPVSAVASEPSPAGIAAALISAGRLSTDSR
ncbi:uroporphyrinogen-III synthase [Arthrobacter roseus]|uniref:uroporphyrinogen-III synthase n=1 Tax=Arthrobacter roseus TaxID=136274 RepID=UPI001964B1B6|nr:uroporphyrinogen-III synthase [Arthrobacter roseus]MBM7849161.1 uroporphyrinogen-III synthase/uroporphyrinogen III methyltransferase/synthase [Arthrobacter roseus]